MKAPPQRVATLLRGVNVGKGRRVPMADFKALLVDLGGRDVATLLNSGNGVCTLEGDRIPGLAAEVAAGLEARLGVAVPVIVKTATDWQAALEGCPWTVAAEDHARLLVAFAPDAATLAALQPLQAQALPPERFHVGAHAAYLHAPQGVLDSTVGAALLGRIGRSVTTRNWATCLKLAALLARS